MPGTPSPGQKPATRHFKTPKRKSSGAHRRCPNCAACKIVPPTRRTPPRVRCAKNIWRGAYALSTALFARGKVMPPDAEIDTLGCFEPEDNARLWPAWIYYISDPDPNAAYWRLP